MKHWVLYLLGLLLVAALGGMPFSGTDVAQLQPVQVVQVARTVDRVVVRTDTDDYGSGATLSGAFEDLKRTTSGKIFLETAEYLLLSAGTEDLIPELTEYLRPGCSVCVVAGEEDLESVAAYLEAHPLLVTLQDCRAEAVELPLLLAYEGRLELVQS
ncbi:MAG: hypothetical protein J6Q53_00010 [Oscillospiraceae bacterium]|nr:hypothetical protein [Oscillospiraceae bacterium]